MPAALLVASAPESDGRTSLQQLMGIIPRVADASRAAPGKSLLALKLGWSRGVLGLALALLLGGCTTTLQHDWGAVLIHEDSPRGRTCRFDGEAPWPDVFPPDALRFELGPGDEVSAIRSASSITLRHCMRSYALHAMMEGSLSPLLPGVESYRFTWLRSFAEPVVIRIDRWGPIHSLTVKEHGGRDAPLRVDSRRLLAPSQWWEFRRRLERARFWSAVRAPVHSYVFGDGAAWILEGSHGRRYRALEYYSPSREGTAGVFREACQYLVELSGLSY